MREKHPVKMRVHPRVCGGTRRRPPSLPRCLRKSGARVHPRVCGGTRRPRLFWRAVDGPSPRMRGHPERSAAGRGSCGSIPAYAGAPPPSRASRRTNRVHPRVCGGTVVSTAPLTGGTGPSPRMRGHLVEDDFGRNFLRSIPAYARAPYVLSRLVSNRRVHPRVCGGTWERAPRWLAGWGPSPRMRGHPDCGLGKTIMQRSIPAYAGAPFMFATRAMTAGVHPRVCGGTLMPETSGPKNGGPSPRMRGHPGEAVLDVDDGGSIPAYAGAPLLKSLNAWGARVHPRVCGGTVKVI